MLPRSASGAFRLSPPLLVLALLCAAELAGQTPVLLKDINPRLAPNPPSDPGSFAMLGGVTYFAAETAKRGRELWRTDGTARGTSLVLDIVPGPSGSSPALMTVIGGTLFFVAWSEQHGRELWRSDGTARGTSLLRDIRPGPADSAISQLTQVAGTLYFAADDGVSGLELWKSDGVATGMVKDIARGPVGSSPVELTAFRGALCFSADDGTNGKELWKSDGSPSGTSMVLDIAPGRPGSDPATLTSSAPGLMFSVRIGVRTELWRSDGTGRGTSLVLALGTTPRLMTSFGQHVVFEDSDPRTSQYFLRRTDGTKPGTVQVSPSFGWISELRVSGRSLFFSPMTRIGRELWKSDGTSRGTVRVKAVPAFGLTPTGSSLFFLIAPTRSAVELWRSDGTGPGTLSLKKYPWSAGKKYPWLFGVGNGLLFSADDGATGNELWMSAGTPQTTLLVKDIHPSGVTLDSDPLVIGELDGTAFVSASDGSTGVELWKTDGSAAGTVLVRDIRPGPPGSNVWALGALGREMILSAEGGVHGRELWKTDGTRRGTTLIRDIRPGPMGSAIRIPRIIGGILYFAADDGIHGVELWRTDGTAAGTRLVADIVPGPGHSRPYHLTAFRDQLFFSVEWGLGYHLYRSDGTTTVRVSKLWLDDPNTRKFAGYLQPFGVYRGELYFSATDGRTGYELWKSDGTDAGTVLVKDIRRGARGSSPWDWLVVDDVLYFRADDGIHGSELWRSDGTSSGTTLVADVQNGAGGSDPRPLRGMNGALLFGVNVGPGSLELWQSRGTGATTSLVTRNWGGYADGLPGGSRRGYFAGAVASGQLRRWGLWETNGTPSGTRALHQPRPWRGSFAPSSITLVRGKFLFAASDPLAGRELWILDPGATAQRAGVPCGAAARRPALDASDPVLGNTMQITGRQAPPGALGLLLVGARARPPVRFGGTCHAYVDPASFATLHAFVATRATWKLPLRLPAGKSLAGAHFALQSWFLHPTRGIALSNAVWLTLGL